MRSSDSHGRLLAALGTVAFLAAAPAWPQAAAPAEPTEDPRPTVLAVGLGSAVPDEAWRERRLGMGLRGRLAQMLADCGAFVTLEERELAPSVAEAVDGYWLRERPEEGAAAGEAGLDALHEATGAEWIGHGLLQSVGVTRDRVSGIAGGRRWAYRASVRLCLHRRGEASLCRDGTGRSVTRVMSAGVQYRGDEVAFDQAGPAQAVDRALVDAFDRLMPAWESAR